MGCCTSTPSGGAQRAAGRAGGHGAPKARYQPKSYRCPNAWCLEFVPAGTYAAHREQCNRQRQLMCAKCGEQIAFKEFEAHLASCDVVPCPHCDETVLKVLLPYCPRVLATRKHVRPPSADLGDSCLNKHEHDAAATIQRAARLGWTRQKWQAIIFRMVWFRIDRWDERGLFKSSRGSAQPVAPAKRLSVILKNKPSFEAQKTSQDILKYPAEGLGGLSSGTGDGGANEKADHIQELRALMDLQQVPYMYFLRVLEDAHSALLAQPNVMEFNLVQGERCIVVGDLHGQLQDLNRILDDRGLPSDKVYYVFNGDFVDRGCNSCEVLTLVLALYLAYPDRVILNRGNHESVACTEQYGCRAEVITKYSDYLFRQCVNVFNAMPLASVCNGQILIVHGGLPRHASATIADINNIDRYREIPVSPRGDLEQMFMDLMWSDPDPEPYEPSMRDWEHNTIRDAGCKWRLPLTQKFCTRNNVSLVLRSHHPPHAGYERLHEGLVTTLFSASNYTGVDSNHGAVAILTLSPGSQTVSVLYDTWKIYEPLGKDIDSPLWGPHGAGEPPGSPESVLVRGGSPRRGDYGSSSPYCTPPFSPVGANGQPLFAHTIHKWMTSQRDVVRQLRERIYNNHHMLMSSFCEVDSTRKGSVWKSEWVEVMSALICADLPWYFLRRFLVDLDPLTGRISFSRFIHRFMVPLEDRLFDAWLPHIVKWLQVQCLKFYSSVADAFDHSDLNHSRTLYYTEFFDMVANKLGALLQKDLVLKLYIALDPQRTGYVTRENFINFFEMYNDSGYIADVQNWVGFWASDARQYILWDQWLLRRFKKYLKDLPARTAFRLITRENHEHVTVGDLRYAISKMSLTGNFRQNVQEGHLNHEALDFRKQVVYRPGKREDPGYIAELFGVPEAHVAGNLRAAGCIIGVWPLSDHQLNEFLRRLDYDRDGVVTYGDFRNALFVQDRTGEVELYPHSRRESLNYRVPMSLSVPVPVLDKAPLSRAGRGGRAG